MLFWHVFKENVEPMVRLLHNPTMANLVERALWHRHTLSTAEHALLFSIYYVATAAVGEETVSTNQFRCFPQPQLMQYFRSFENFPSPKALCSVACECW